MGSVGDILYKIKGLDRRNIQGALDWGKSNILTFYLSHSFYVTFYLSPLVSSHFPHLFMYDFVPFFVLAAATTLH